MKDVNGKKDVGQKILNEKSFVKQRIFIIVMLAIVISILAILYVIANQNARASEDGTASQNVATNQNISMKVIPNPNIDIVLTKGKSAVSLDTFENDIKSKLDSLGVDSSRVKVQAIESKIVESQTSFTWNNDVSSSIGSIAIENNGQNITMSGNTSTAGSNAIWIMPNGNSDQEFKFDYNINFGDSFNAAGMLLRVEQQGQTLNGYMLSFNNTNWKSAAGGTNGAIWKFTYTIGSHANITKTLVTRLTISTSGTLSVKATDTTITVSGGGLASPTEIKLPTIYGSGYGFFSDHYSHNCSNIGAFTLKNINLQMGTIKSFKEVLNQPEWRDESIRAIVNVTDSTAEEFNKSSTLSEILSKVLNDGISYIGWGTSNNKAEIENVISNNDNKGTYIENNNYSDAITKTAEYIKSVVVNQQESQYIIAGQPVDIQISPSNITSNTIDSEYKDGKWKAVHEYDYYENPEKQYEKSGIYTDSIISEFENPGKYTIYYGKDQITPGIIYANRRPVAEFNVKVDGTAVTLQSTSYDLDKQSDNNGISTEVWSYKKVNDSGWTEGKPTNIEKNADYLVKLQVEDFQNTWSTPSTKHIISNEGTSLPTLASQVNVGDYVNYDATNNGTYSYTTNSTLTGSTTATTFNSSDTMKWRVLSVNKTTGAVELMSADPTASTVTLSGKAGYKNAETVLNGIGAVYGHGKGATSGRSITVEDVEQYSSYDKTTYANSYSSTGKYGGTRTYTSGTFINADGSEVTASSSNPVTETQTNYWYTASSYYSNTTAYKMLFRNAADSANKRTYWLASRCVGLNNSDCDFDVRYVNGGSVCSNNLYSSYGNTSSSTYAGVPVVSLTSNIQTSGKDANGAWNLNGVNIVESKPVASFNLKKNSISIYDKLEVTDNSYDPASTQISKYEWKILRIIH